MPSPFAIIRTQSLCAAEIDIALALMLGIRETRHTLGHPVARCGGKKVSMRVWIACFWMIFAGTVYAADAGSPDAALAVTRAFLSDRFSIVDRPTLTPDNKAIVNVTRGKLACTVTLIRRASVLSGWKICAQDCKATKPKRDPHG
jgi:hypothetical protein